MPRRFDLASFESFSDSPESAFCCGDGLTPDETWSRIVQGMERALSAAIDFALARREIDPSFIAQAHRITFEDVFPGDAGRFRGMLPDGRPEEVWFGVRVGTAQTSRIRQTKGSHPARIEENLGRACSQFESRAYEIRTGPVATVRDAVEACAILYAKIANIHPFVDGNLRAAYVTLQAALLSLDLPLVQFPDLDAHDDAIDQALRVDSNQTYAPLISLIEGVVRSA
jgi:fido (protein-threonine AMPylation protein)